MSTEIEGASLCVTDAVVDSLITGVTKHILDGSCRHKRLPYASQLTAQLVNQGVMMKLMQPSGRVGKVVSEGRAANTTVPDNMYCDAIKHTYVPAPEKPQPISPDTIEDLFEAPRTRYSGLSGLSPRSNKTGNKRNLKRVASSMQVPLP